jgi:hypothetical protein
MDYDETVNQSARVGRIGELIVEKMLTEAGWLCGNINVSVNNSRSWDLFAKKGRKTRAIRVKSSSSEDVTWGARNGVDNAIQEYTDGDVSDWTAVVVNVESTDMRVYIIPTPEIIDAALNANLPSETRILHLHFKNTKREKVKYPNQWGMNEKFRKYLGNVEL